MVQSSEALEQLASLARDTRKFAPKQVEDGSIADQDRLSFPGDSDREYFLAKLVERAALSLDLTGEVVQGVARLLGPPILGETPALLLRTGFESASLVDWLCSESLAAEVRVQRGVAVLRNDYNREAGTLAKIADQARGTSVEGDAHLAVTGIGGLADRALERARQAGIKLVRVPNQTNRVEKLLGSSLYAVYSDVAHDTRSGPRVAALRSSVNTDKDAGDALEQTYIEISALTYLVASSGFISYVSAPHSLKHFRDGLGELYGGLVRSAGGLSSNHGGPGPAG